MANTAVKPPQYSFLPPREARPPTIHSKSHQTDLLGHLLDTFSCLLPGLGFGICPSPWQAFSPGSPHWAPTREHNTQDPSRLGPRRLDITPRTRITRRPRSKKITPKQYLRAPMQEYNPRPRFKKITPQQLRGHTQKISPERIPEQKKMEDRRGDGSKGGWDLYRYVLCSHALCRFYRGGLSEPKPYTLNPKP